MLKRALIAVILLHLAAHSVLAMPAQAQSPESDAPYLYYFDNELLDSSSSTATAYTPMKQGLADSRQYSNDPSDVLAVAFSPDGNTVATASRGGVVTVWENASGRAVQRLEHSDAVFSLSYAPDGSLVTGGADGIARRWDIREGKDSQEYARHTGPISAIAVSTAGRTLVTSGYDGYLRTWDTRLGLHRREIDTLVGSVFDMATTPDGRLALVGGVSGIARLWNMDLGHEMMSYYGHTEAITSVAISPDSHTALTGSIDHSARLWDIATGQARLVLLGHEDPVWGVAFAPDGQAVLTGSGGDNGDFTARLWEVETGMEIERIVGHSDRICCVAFSPDGQTVLTGSDDGTARLWDVLTAREIQRFTLENTITDGTQLAANRSWDIDIFSVVLIGDFAHKREGA